MATMRAGVTHWQAGLIEVGHGMICKAYSILMVTHGPTHPITKDLEVCFQLLFEASVPSYYTDLRIVVVY